MSWGKNEKIIVFLFSVLFALFVLLKRWHLNLLGWACKIICLLALNVGKCYKINKSQSWESWKFIRQKVRLENDYLSCFSHFLCHCHRHSRHCSLFLGSRGYCLNQFSWRVFLQTTTPYNGVWVFRLWYN